LRKEKKSERKDFFLSNKDCEETNICLPVSAAEELKASANQATDSSAPTIIFFTVNTARLQGR
jgi:hypothetical protein